MTDQKFPGPGSHSLKEGSRNKNIRSTNWPPKIVWARELGWLNVRDPFDGTWHSIPAKEAPSGWARLASEAKR